MTDKQSKALRLADEHDNDDYVASTRQWREEAAAELRRLHERETELAARLGETIPALEEAAAELDRLHELNADLVEALERLARLGNGDSYGNSIGNDIAIAALAKAEGK